MLIISRKLGESFVIDDEIEVFVLDSQNGKIRIGINAPRSVKILRKELYETEKTNREAEKSVDKAQYNELIMAIRNKKNI